MINIDISLLMQLANFLVLLAALHFILFKPFRQIMQEREQGISASLGDAKNATKHMCDLKEQYATSLAEAKQKAATAYNELYQQGLDIQRDLIARERATAGELLDKARGEIVTASNTARTDLRKEAEKLSREITIKLLGRAV